MRALDPALMRALDRVRAPVCAAAIATVLSFVALRTVPDEEWSHLGHQFVGVLLAFLAVFRTSNSHSLWEQGRIFTGQMNSAARCFANEVLGCIVEAAVQDGTAELPHDAHECIRLLKLVYFVSVEHVVRRHLSHNPASPPHGHLWAVRRAAA